MSEATRVLIIEDYLDLRESIIRFLSVDGLTVSRSETEFDGDTEKIHNHWRRQKGRLKKRF